MRAAGVDPGTLPVSIGLTVDEEEDGPGSMALASLGPPRHVIALEGTELEICTAEAGTLQCLVQVPGRSHHGSRPELGDNAVHKGLDLARGLLALPVLNRPHPETVDNVAFIQEFTGGSDLYVVPDSARLQVVARLGAVGEAAEARAAIAALCRRRGAAFELIEAVDPVLTDAAHPLVTSLGHGVRRVRGQEPGTRPCRRGPTRTASPRRAPASWSSGRAACATRTAPTSTSTYARSSRARRSWPT